MKARNLAFLAVTIATLIYAMTFTIAKHVMPQYVKPFGFILLRVSGATLLFWIFGLFSKKENIELKDFKTIFLAAIFGVALNMLTFFEGLSLTTPINAAVFMLTTPILVLVFSTILLKERITLQKGLGITIGLIGAFILIVYGTNTTALGSNVMLGNFLVFINAASYALYLIIVKNLTNKYHPFTFVKWLYLFGLVLVFPFGIKQLKAINWQLMPVDIWYKIGFVVFFATFITYLFNLLALRKLKPTTVSVFIYLQPVFATFFALFMKSDSLNIVKIGASALIFLGVFLVTKPSKI